MASFNKDDQQSQEPWFLKSSFPVFLPKFPALTASPDEFEAYIHWNVKPTGAVETDNAALTGGKGDAVTETDTETVLISEPSTTAEARGRLSNMNVESTGSETGEASPAHNHPFMKGLLSHQNDDSNAGDKIESMENKMFTENSDVAHRSTTNPLVDLFHELEDVVSGPRLLELLQGAWEDDPLTTLKIIFNARSIHLGKASRHTFYRCAGWLAQAHPQTLLANLAWLSRPVIQKKVEKKCDEEDVVIVEEELNSDDPARFDVKSGVAHGYWKDLLNLLALHANGKLHVLANPRDILNIEKELDSRKWPKNQKEAKSRRHEKRDTRHMTAVKLLNEDCVYRGLHLAVARLFATQLKVDLALLNGNDAAAKRTISLCAKWAPSSERFADKHTFIVSSIAEILYPLSGFKGFANYDPIDVEQRTLYLRHARNAYRKDVTALRKQLDVVERQITAKTYKNIKYDRVPSLAMNNYAPLFAKKDPERFERYIVKVADGKARISGATLLPSTLVKVARAGTHGASESIDMVSRKRKLKGTNDLVQAKMNELAGKALDGQWRALVQRIKDSGTLENCIAVTDVSGSMNRPFFPDGTTPMDSSIGLSLLIAEVCRPPFGGAFITFSTDPRVEKIDLSLSFREKVAHLSQANWTMSTDFVAVFEKLILPMAIKNNLRQEDMVKRVFVFSDMQFDSAARYPYSYESGASSSPKRWSTSYERIEKQYQDAGYEMPELVFWNLAGGRAGYRGGYGAGDPIAPKPVTVGENGTALVSGYSQGMLKVFLDNSTFEEENVEEEVIEKISQGGEVVVEKVKKQKLDPLSVVQRAIGHRAYDMLRIVD